MSQPKLSNKNTTEPRLPESVRGRLSMMVLLTGLLTLNLSAQTAVNVSTLAELRTAVEKSNQVIVMKPGKYSLNDLASGSRSIACSGSRNTIDLTGVYVNAPVGSTSKTYVTISGDNNTWRGGEFEDTYLNGIEEVRDFSSYNQDRSTLAKGLKGGPVLRVSGDNNRVVGVKLTVRGSFPYGYGSIYGIGRNNVAGLDKRCGILITGVNNTIDGSEVQQRAFGHGIYMQGEADGTLIKNTLVEGIMRPSKDLYLEKKPYDLPNRFHYQLPLKNNQPIPKDVMLPLPEDGIRAYNIRGSVTVENCVVKKMRGGVRLYLAKSASVSNTMSIDCGATNYNMPSDTTITNSSGNFAFAPLLDFRLSRSRQTIEMTILPSPHATGPHNIADIIGGGHHLVFRRAAGSLDTARRPIVVVEDNNTIRNETEYPILLQETASGNTIVSFGQVTDHGSNNKVTQIEQVNVKAGQPGR